MVVQNGRYALVYNGEIYNFKELFLRLCPQDGSVNGNSDTAVLLYLLNNYGKKCLPWLEGMFSFAHVDFHTNEFLLARDRFGEKPLYFRYESDFFAFASELSTLRRLIPEKAWELSAEAIGLYHIVGSVPAPSSIFEGVSMVQPGYALSFQPDKGAEHHCYWTGLLSEAEPPARSWDEAVRVTQSLLLGAVRSRLVSDVPVGLFLSGGFDSSALLSCCAELGHPQTLAVCVDFEEPEFSEFSKASSVAKHYGATVHRHVVTKGSFESSLSEFFSAMDQPTCDGYNTFFVCGAAKQFGIKVWLSGVGGDELFGGYQSFRRMALWSRMSTTLQSIISPQIMDFAASRFPTHHRLSRILHMGDRGDSRKRAYQACRNSVPWRNALGFLSPQLLSKLGGLQQRLDACYPDPAVIMDDFQAVTMFESSVYMRSQLLRDMDNFSMTHSLELRAPFLDSRLFGAVYSMSERIKSKGATIKPLLGASVPIAFPQEILRQDKQGFGFPVDLWLRKGLERWFVDAAEAIEHHEIWNMSAVRALWDGYLDRKVHWSIMWNLFSFAKWVAAHSEDR